MALRVLSGAPSGTGPELRSKAKVAPADSSTVEVGAAGIKDENNPFCSLLNGLSG